MTSSLDILKHIIRQQTVHVGEPVANLHGAAVPEPSRLQVSAFATWQYVSIPGIRPLDLEQFYAVYGTDPLRQVVSLTAIEGRVVVTNTEPRTGVLRGAVDLVNPTTIAVDFVGEGVTQATLFVDGVRAKGGSGARSWAVMVDAGTHILEVLVTGTVFGLSLPASVGVNAIKEHVNTPVWLAVDATYADPVAGPPATRLRWYNDVRVGGWIVSRRVLADLAPVFRVGLLDQNRAFSVEIEGNFALNIPVRSGLFAGFEPIGVVLSGEYDADQDLTIVRVQLNQQLTIVNPAWVGRELRTGSFHEISRVQRNTQGDVVELLDTAVSLGQGYEYVLQAYGLVNPEALSEQSEARLVRAGDSTPPSSIGLAAGYPIVLNKRAIVRFTTPSDADYSGVYVYRRRTVVTGTATGGSANTLTAGPVFTANAVGAVVAIIGGTGAGQERVVQSHTTTQLQVSTNWSSAPDATSQFEVYFWERIITDFGVPGTTDEVSFAVDVAATYYFVTVDQAGNQQEPSVAVSWAYNPVVHDTVTGPSLIVTPLPGLARYQITWSGTGNITYAVDGGLFVLPPASPFFVNRKLYGRGDTTLTFRAVADGLTMANVVTVPEQAQDGGTPIFSNPVFFDGLNRFSVYDNNNTGLNSHALVTDNTTPNSTGRFLRITRAPGAGTTPGLGGFYLALPWDGGSYRLDHYHKGAVVLFRVRSRVPVGYTVGYATNAAGDGATITELSPMVGTGNWEDYVVRHAIGSSTGTFSSIGFFYLSGATPVSPLVWDVAMCSVKDATQEGEPEQLTPDLTVTQTTADHTQVVFRVNATHPKTGAFVTPTVQLTGTTGTVGGVPISGVTAIPSALTDVVVMRPAYGSGDATATFSAVINGAREVIQRTVRNTFPEISNWNYGVDVVRGRVFVTGAVDDDAGSLRWWVAQDLDPDGTDPTPGSPALIQNLAITKSFAFNFAVPDGRQNTLYMQPYAFSNGTGTVGPIYSYDISSAPRTAIAIEERNLVGLVVADRVTARFTARPEIPIIESGMTSASTATTLTDNSRSWTVNQFAYDAANRSHYYVVSGSQIRRIVSNTGNVLTVTPSWTPPAGAYQIWGGATLFKIGTGGTFSPVLGSVEILRGVATTTVAYYTELNGVVAEPIQQITIDADSTPSLASVSLAKISSGVLQVTRGAADDDCKLWKAYLRKGTYPTVDGTATGALDEQFLRFTDVVDRASFQMGAGDGTWYCIAVPINSYSDRGERVSATFVMDSAPALGALSNLRIVTFTNGSPPNDQYHRILWDHNSACENPDTTHQVRIYGYRSDQGVPGETEKTAGLTRRPWQEVATPFDGDLTNDGNVNNLQGSFQVPVGTSGNLNTLTYYYRVELWVSGVLQSAYYVEKIDTYGMVPPSNLTPQGQWSYEFGNKTYWVQPFTWTPGETGAGVQTELLEASSTVFANAVVVSAVPASQTSTSGTDRPAGGAQFWYWVRHRSGSEVSAAFGPVGPIVYGSGGGA